MGSAEEQTPTPPAKSASQDSPAVTFTPSWPPAAYYSGATPPPFFSPPVWGSQHMISPYGTAIPYSTMYPHAVYGHPPPGVAITLPAVESNTKSKGKSGDGGGKVTSGSADDERGSHSGGGGESGSEGSSDTREHDRETPGSARKRHYNDAFNEGENSQLKTGAQNNGTTAESSYSGRQRTVSKLPVSAPGRTTLPDPVTKLNIGLDVWAASDVATAPVSVASPTVRANAVVPDRQWVQDERELKREKRKQSNRESARRSRLRKQQECEDLARKVAEMTAENNALKVELEQLYKVCKDLEVENASITVLKLGIGSGIEFFQIFGSGSGSAGVVVVVSDRYFEFF